MCTFDRNTKKKLSDCGHCGCGQSKNWGQHDRSAGTKCVRCGAYLHQK
jgi:hypothetical protein